ncbi:MAG: winged helix DNA-binding domain-containing protein [Acetobacteraceae bacterium]|nr:winged helix DNA-binding domain-containing protein [Acetobacteraceae bacterium]
MRVSCEQAAAFTIARHRLSAPATSPLQGSDIAYDVLGLHAQVLNSALLSIAVRVPEYNRASLSSELYVRRSLVKVWCMRGTLHLLSSRDYPLFLSGIMRPRASGYAALLARCGLSPDQIDTLPDRVRAALSHGPLTRKELHAAVPDLSRLPAAAWGEDVKDLCYMGVLVHADPRGNEARFALARDWLNGASDGPDAPHDVPDDTGVDKAVADLLRRYLRAYGPASAGDFAYWAGFDRIDPALRAKEMLGDEIEMVEVTGYRNPLMLVVADLPDLRHAEPPPGVFVLPMFDPMMMAYRDRRRFVDQSRRSSLVKPGGFIAATLWSRGRIVGTWEYKVAGKRAVVRVSPFSQLTREERSGLDGALQPLCAALGAPELAVTIEDL